MQPSYTVQEAADRLGVSTSTIYSYEKRNLLERMEDPHRLFSGIRFPKEAVEQLKREKEDRNSAGRSVTEVASRLGVYPGKVSDAIAALHLPVSMVQSGLSEHSYRYAISAEQEEAIRDYIKRQKTTRPKRNHLYRLKEDVALYQSFRIAGEHPVRIKQNGKGEVGFYLENEVFVPYVEALRSYDLEPRYSIHHSKITSSSSFTDLVIPMGKMAFYQLLDVLYAVCGVENFNAEVRDGFLFISIRNGSYPANSFATKEALALVNRHIESGTVKAAGDAWIFMHNEKSLLISLEEQVYDDLKKVASHSNLSLKDWVQQLLIEKRNEYREN